MPASPLAADSWRLEPRGVEHRTAADSEAEVLIFEPVDVLDTGNVVVEDFTAPQGVWI